MRRIRSERCAHWWERRTPGKRYVNARGQCTRMVAHPSGYCKEHRYGYRWSEQHEAKYRKDKAVPR